MPRLCGFKPYYSCLRRSSWLLSSGESCGSRPRLRGRSALILVQGVRHQRAKVTVFTGRWDYPRACAAGPRDTICGAVVELDMILPSGPSKRSLRLQSAEPAPATAQTQEGERRMLRSRRRRRPRRGDSGSEAAFSGAVGALCGSSGAGQFAISRLIE